MAESLVQVTEGSGKKLHTFQRTIGANAVEDEVIIVGEPYLATYLAVFRTAITMNNAAATQLIQLMAGSTLKVYVRRITLYQVGLAAAASLFYADVWRVNAAPTGGIAVTPSLLDGSDGASGATAAYLPTGAGTITTCVGIGVLNVQTVAPVTGLAPKLEWLFPNNAGAKSLVIPAGTTNGIVIRNNQGANAGSLLAEIEFVEANF